MTPINYVSRREAIAIIAAAKSAGIPDRQAVIEARQAGIDAADGLANDEAIADLWQAVDQGKLDAIAHGPSDRWLKMSAQETNQVPLLRALHGGDFTFLRPGNSFYESVISEFGLRLGLVKLVFRKDQVEKVARLVQRRRRKNVASAACTPSIGRPSRRDQLCSCIRQMIEDGRWDTSISLKTLVQLVQRSLKWDKGLSEATIARALDWLYDNGQDRKFCRMRRKPNNSKRSSPAPERTTSAWF